MRDIAAVPNYKGLNPMRLVLDIERSADGRPEGSLRPGEGQEAFPFSGVLEFIATLEELLLAVGPVPGADTAEPGEEGRTGQ